MGADFCALLRYDSRYVNSSKALDVLECGRPPLLQNVFDTWHQYGFANLSGDKTEWIERRTHRVLEMRPELPDIRWSLKTREGFVLTFGEDSVFVYHILRWYRFLIDAEWQRVMLDACHAVVDILGASEAVVSRDESPVLLAFWKGASFTECLTAGSGCEGEKLKIADLLEIVAERGSWDSHGYWRFRPERTKQ